IAAFFQKHDSIIGVANLARAFDNRLQRRTDVGRRGSDDLQDVAAASLIDQRLFKVTRFGLHLLKQLHVLDRNHSLIGEGAQEVHILRGKRPRLRSSNADGADDAALALERHHEPASKSARASNVPAGLGLSIGGSVDGLRYLTAGNLLEV